MTMTFAILALLLLIALTVALARVIQADGRGHTPPRSHPAWDDRLTGLPPR
ncbi:hypothetical protein OEB99_07375 [Actinotalea sp. M2MS4P-6]|uniref:hypothetical protein n=1 Tax=Actinotalea sp. M2MS4P-6 TaxID=2983762 RepID=UPI0021E4742B|nr:hypothetical protein [Actinotalea sp. M2MS4P-6]MCV2394122.1 hypothetical protein [Actinotalea sp. M2MS4P-6]